MGLFGPSNLSVQNSNDISSLASQMSDMKVQASYMQGLISAQQRTIESLGGNKDVHVYNTYTYNNTTNVYNYHAAPQQQVPAPVPRVTIEYPVESAPTSRINVEYPRAAPRPRHKKNVEPDWFRLVEDSTSKTQLQSLVARMHRETTWSFKGYKDMAGAGVSLAECKAILKGMIRRESR